MQRDANKVDREASQLVDRLRQYRPTDEWGQGVQHTICNEAADEIELLQMDVAIFNGHRHELLKKFVDAPSPVDREDIGRALADAMCERQRQVDAEGWISQHDDQYRNDELPRAAICYLLGNAGNWPWSRNWWKPTDRRRDLVKAAALIVAEIERLDRAAAKSSAGEKGTTR